MKNVNFKLQNIIFYYDQKLDRHWWMLNRHHHMEYDKINSVHTLYPGQYAEFFTYFNSFSLGKWKKFTKVEDVFLNLRCKGHFKIDLFGHYRRGNEIMREDYPSQVFDLKEMTDISIMIPRDSIAEVVGWAIDVLHDEPVLTTRYYTRKGELVDEEELEEMTEAEIAKLTARKEMVAPKPRKFCVESGYWSTDVSEDAINDVRIAIASTTFKKEQFIIRNMKVLERELFYSDEPAKDHIRMNIVDNGRTLDPELYNSEFIHIFPNQNVGGSGGFTRGMLESLQMDWNPTHVLLMDDDVRIMPESLIRTYTMLALVKPEHADRYVSGAMLFMEDDRMNFQHEDVGYVHADGSYGPNKPPMPLHEWHCVFMNDELRTTEYAADSYAGWWYCCIPVSTINTKDGLPIPVFIRGDDVEYSVANKAQFLSLNGICIWHLGFGNKFTGSLELYQVHRNSLILQAMSKVCQDKDFVKRIDEFFHKELARLSYANCEHLLDSIEDYCQGPDFLRDPAQGERCMKQQGAKNEKMINADREYPSIPVDWGRIYWREEKQLTPFQEWLYKNTYNGQRWIPAGWFIKKGKDGKPNTAAIAYDWFDDPAKQYGAEQILAVNPFDHTAFLRKRDKKKFKELMARHKRVLKNYYKNKDKIAKAYYDAAKELKGETFWREYLHMDAKETN
ncbi:MAG: glycosyltransferase [Ruminococcus sp.]|nr:glycosyltransferase [Oscillospiraceae bacterium]MBQ8686945.1 glycosyltransferase [Ruminococcus sp.]